MNVRTLMVALALSSSMAGCRAIEGIFKAGVWVGVVIVALVLMLAFGATRLIRR